MSDAKVKVDSVVIDGAEYVRKDTLPASPTGTRAVVVVDRGWIFAGDVTRQNGRLLLDRAVHVRSWSELGFDGMVANPSDKKVVLRKLSNHVDIPERSELFCIPVADRWGL